MNDEALLAQIIYPIIFDKYPIESLARVVSILKRDLSLDDLTRLSILLKSRQFDANHPSINSHSPICEKKDLDLYLAALAEEF